MMATTAVGLVLWERIQGKKRMNILLIEDNEAIILGVQYLLEQEGFRVLTAKSAAQGIKCFQEETCHLILLDVCLPDGNGFELCKKIRESSGVPIIFLTAREEEVDVVRGLELEADDYIIKPFRNRELVSRIRSVLRRSGQAQTMLRCGDISLDTVTGKIRRGEEEILLTKLEFKIFSAMLSYPGKLFTREEILAEIWDSSGNFVNDNTLSVTIKRIREKIGDIDGKRIRTVRGIGYRLEK